LKSHFLKESFIKFNLNKFIISIIYEDNDVLAINKPAGLVVHKGLTFVTKVKPLCVVGPSVVDWLLENKPEIKGVGEDSERPGIVHRLDKDTSGILLIAKNQKTFEYLKNQFSAPSLYYSKKEGRDLASGGQERKVKKTYLALVCGKLKVESGIIDLAIGKSKSDFRKKTCLLAGMATNKAIGKIREAVTEYKVKKIFNDPVSPAGRYTFVEVYPKTGRTHQIRAHFKAIGHPIVCDKLYGSKKQECPFDLTRHFLHASALELELPSDGRIKLEADLPDDLQNVLNMLD